MGGGRFEPSAYSAFTDSTVGVATADIYTSRSVHDIGILNPKGVKVRESRDSVDNPLSTPIIVGIDVTGSMGILADTIARKGLGVLFEGILDRNPVTDPHIMFMGIGDANCDSAPLQVSQFEADKRIIEQLTQIWIEHGGGGNNFESYNLPWYFAAFHTVHDAMEKRGKRGYLFTVGDEQVPDALTKEQISKFIGDDIEKALSTEDTLQLAQRLYDVYHVIVGEGSHAKARGRDYMTQNWSKLMGQHVIYLADHQKLAETIVSAIEVAEGADAHASASGWGAGAGVVYEAVKALPRGTAVSGRPMLGGPAR